MGLHAQLDFNREDKFDYALNYDLIEKMNGIIFSIPPYIYSVRMKMSDYTPNPFHEERALNLEFPKEPVIIIRYKC